MKTLFNHRTALIIAMALMCNTCAKEEIDVFGSISGTVRDAQQQPIEGVSVSLTPGGLTKSTGKDGSYVFIDLESKQYTLAYSKNEYITVSKTTTVQAGMNNVIDVTLEKEQLVPVLEVGTKTLDFGTEKTTLSLEISNTGKGALSWAIAYSPGVWFTCSPSIGTIAAGGKSSVVVTASRSQKENGTYHESFAISSNGGNCDVEVAMTVPANDKPSVSIEQPRDITATGATFTGAILSVGKDHVTSHGFCWNTSPNPTINNNTSNLGDCTTPKSFESVATDLQEGTTYYVKAYAQNSVGIAYTDEQTFTTIGTSNVPVTSVSLDQTSLNKNIGDPSVTLHATVYPDNASNKNVSWSTGNEAVATVNDNGTITFVGAGETNISVRTQDGNKTATCHVTVTANASNIGGTTGTLTWSLSNGTLTISGSGAMPDYDFDYVSFSSIPWETYRDKITTVTIQNGVTSIGNYAFGNSSITSITIPNSVTSIGSYAFVNCARFTSVTIPSSVTSIESDAFTNCGITSITILYGLTHIRNNTFPECHSLTSLTLPNSVTYIGDAAFYGCNSLASVNIPNSVTTIGDEAFRGCTSLRNVVVLRTTPPSIASNTFVDVPFSSATLTVPSGSKSAYQNAEGWKDFGTIIEAGGSSTVPVTSVSLNQTSLNKQVGDPAVTLTTTVNPTNASNKSVNWSTSNSSVATVDNGVVNFVGAGSAEITVTTQDGGKTATCNVTVTGTTPANVPVTSVSLNQTSLNKQVGDPAVTLTATINPTNASNKNVSWSTSNSSVATVNNGVVNFVGAGSAEITVTTQDGGKTATCNVTVTASSSNIGGTTGPLTWSLEGGTLTISGTGSMPNYVMYISLQITYPWFDYRDNITTVYIQDGVGNIGNFAFYGCNSLTSINIPNSVTQIGNAAFGRCSSLTSIAIPNSVTTIGREAFSACGLTSITIPNAVQVLEMMLFQSCSSLTSITIPNSVTSIGAQVFQGCTSLTSITIPNSVATIGAMAFYDCSSLNNVVVLRTTPPSIASDAFGNVPLSSATLTVPSGSKSAYQDAAVWKDFGTIIEAGGSSTVPVTSVSLNQTSLNKQLGDPSVTLTATVSPSNASNKNVSWSTNNSSVATVSNGVVNFVGAGSAVITVTTADGNKTATCNVTVTAATVAVTSVSLNQTSLNKQVGDPSVTLTATVSPSNASNKSVNWSTNNPSVATVSNGVVTFVGAGSAVITVTTTDGNKTATCNVTVTAASSGIGGTTGLLTWSYANGILTISGSGAMPDYPSYDSSPWYSYRDDVTTINIQNGVTTIGDNAFYFCISITSITIPNSVTSIGGGAFASCWSLTSITIPNSVTSIGTSVFASCNSLTSITVSSGNTAYASEDGVLFNKTKTMIHSYPRGKTGSTYNIPNSVTTIGNSAFSGCNSLTSITIPNSVTTIGNSAFSSCNSLTSITIPNSVTTIGDWAFSFCNLTSITIPNSVTTIGDYAFYHCSSLTSTTIGNSVTTIGDWAFGDCSSLRNVVVLNTTPPTSNAFQNVPLSSATLTVPNGCKPAYEAAYGWKDFGTIIEAP
jgi:uncharacterized protein YjdB